MKQTTIKRIKTYALQPSKSEKENDKWSKSSLVVKVHVFIMS